MIVVDDGSELPLETVVAPFRKQINLALLKQTNAGPAAARNTGAKHAKGDFLAFTDDDCTPASDWLKVLAKYLEDTPNCLVGGRTINRLTDNIFSATSQLIVDIVYRHYNANPQQVCFFASNNMVIPAQKLNELGGFNTRFRTSEDRELCDRWLYHGYRMIYAQDAVIYHAQQLNLRSFCKQHFNYGRGAYRYHKIRAQRGSGTMLGEMKFHLNLRNWLLYPFTQFSWKKSVLLAGALLLWQLMNALGFLYEAAKQNSIIKRLG